MSAYAGGPVGSLNSLSLPGEIEPFRHFCNAFA